MTAREQAREAAAESFGARCESGRRMRMASADAASDVWEPLLRLATTHLAVWLPGTALVEELQEAVGGK